MKKEYLILSFIILIAALTRFIALDKFPPSLNWDEVSHGYNAYSILKTGKDEWGTWFPLVNFRAYGDYPLPLYMYLSMPWIIFLGLNEFSIRATSAFFGVLLVIVTYAMTRFIVKKPAPSLISTLLITLSPWHIMMSRQVLQATPAIFFIGLGILFFLRGVYKSKITLLSGVILISLSAYAYHNTRILAPILLSVLCVFYLRELLLKKLILPILIIGVIFFIPIIPSIISGRGSARALWVGILDQGAINRINEARTNTSIPQFFAKFIYNRPAYFLATASRNYLGYFSPVYLGFQGGSQYQFSIPGFGLIYPFELIFFYSGVVYIIFFFLKIPKEYKFILVWLLIAPLPAAATRDPYQVVRSSTMLPVVYVVSGVGLSRIIQLLGKKKQQNLMVSCIVVAVVVFAIPYLRNFFIDYPVKYSFSWQYGYKQAVKYIEQHQENYQSVTITKKYGEPHEFFLFFYKFDPNSYRNSQTLVRYEKSNWFWVDSFDKYRFINDWDILQKTENQKNLLLITSPGNYPKNARLLDSIYFLDGAKAFDIVDL